MMPIIKIEIESMKETIRHAFSQQMIDLSSEVKDALDRACTPEKIKFMVEREACVRDLLYGLALHELAFGEDAINVEMSKIEWTDDDDHSVSLFDSGGVYVLSLNITKDAPND